MKVQYMKILSAAQGAEFSHQHQTTLMLAICRSITSLVIRISHYNGFKIIPFHYCNSLKIRLCLQRNPSGANQHCQIEIASDRFLAGVSWLRSPGEQKVREGVFGGCLHSSQPWLPGGPLILCQLAQVIPIP